MEQIARRLVVRGLVQGVGFRWYCARVAAELGVRGWAANLGDGSVEVHAEGPADAVERFVRACRTGPRHAQVTAVEAAETAVRGLSSFSTH